MSIFREGIQEVDKCFTMLRDIQQMKIYSNYSLKLAPM